MLSFSVMYDKYSKHDINVLKFIMVVVYSVLFITRIVLVGLFCVWMYLGLALALTELRDEFFILSVLTMPLVYLISKYICIAFCKVNEIRNNLSNF